MGPLRPGPAKEPLEPLLIVPVPGDVGLALGAVPEAPEFADVPVVPELDDAPDDLPVVGAQSALAAPPLAVAELRVPLLALAVEPPLRLSPALLDAAGGQSALALWPAALAPCVRDDPEALLPPEEAPPTLDVLVEPEPPEDGVVLASTELPEPVVRELMPEVLGLAVCAPARLPAASMARSSAVEPMAFIFPP